MSLVHQAYNMERFSGVATWTMVTASLCYFIVVDSRFDSMHLSITFVACCSYLFMWLMVSQPDGYFKVELTRYVMFALMFVNVIVIYFLVPYSFSAIYMVIWSAALTYFVSVRTALLLSPFWSMPLWLVYGYYWNETYSIVSAILFWTFNLFALIMVNTALKEKQAREKVEQVNRELVSTQQLLNQASKQAERVRIARNIHDLLGHHLTALTINLQVASRQLTLAEQSQGSQQTKRDSTNLDADQATGMQINNNQGCINDAKLKVDQCHSLAKLLLSDVREAVSDIRDKSRIDLSAALQAITENLPTLTVDLQIDENVQIDDVGIAETIIRTVQECITNSLKHAKASELNIRLEQRPEALFISMHDNGKKTKNSIFEPGNGLKGMRERINQYAGSISFDNRMALI